MFRLPFFSIITTFAFLGLSLGILAPNLPTFAQQYQGRISDDRLAYPTGFDPLDFTLIVVN